MPAPWYMSSNGGTGHNTAAPPPAKEPEPTFRPMPESYPDHVPKEAVDLIELLLHFKPDVCSTFVYKWMELPRRLRKEYSYNGAIKCRGPGDPKHYVCPITNQTYYDPSNWVYAVTMRLMLPKMMQEVDWNNETKGDIFEGILGCNYLVANGLVEAPVGAVSKHIGRVSAIFEEFVWSTWALCEKLQHNFTRVLQWVTWINDIVLYRQMRYDTVGTIVLYDPPDEVSFKPRNKSSVYLIQVAFS